VLGEKQYWQFQSRSWKTISRNRGKHKSIQCRYFYTGTLALLNSETNANREQFKFFAKQRMQYFIEVMYCFGDTELMESIKN
jgi:hypothetical protein